MTIKQYISYTNALVWFAHHHFTQKKQVTRAAQNITLQYLRFVYSIFFDVLNLPMLQQRGSLKLEHESVYTSTMIQKIVNTFLKQALASCPCILIGDL